MNFIALSFYLLIISIDSLKFNQQIQYLFMDLFMMDFIDLKVDFI